MTTASEAGCSSRLSGSRGSSSVSAGILLAFVLVWAWAADAQTYSIVLNRGGEPWIMNLDGTGAQKLASVTLKSNPAISNGKVAFALADYGGQGPGVYVMSGTPGSSLTKLTGSQVISSTQAVATELDFSPDGQRLVYSGADSGDYYGNHDLYVQYVSGGGPTKILRETSYHHLYPSWGEPDRILYGRMNVGDAYTQYPFKIAPDGTGKSQFNSTFTQYPRSKGAGGSIVASLGHSGSEHLVVFSSSFLNGTSIPNANGFSFPAWHPTENAVLAVKTSTQDVYKIDVASGQQTRLTYYGNVSSLGLGTGAATAPGQSHALVVNRGGEPWIMNLDGTGAQKLASVTLKSNPAISSGKVAFALADYGGQGPGVYVMSATPGSSLTKLTGSQVISSTQTVATELDFSPDGQRLVYSGADSGDYYGNHDMYVQYVSGGGPTKILRETSYHHLYPSWGEPDRILYGRMNVGDAYTQYPFKIAPDGTGKSQFNSTFTQYPRSKGAGGSIVASLGHSGSEHLVVFSSSFLNGTSIPNANGFSFPAWHPTDNAVLAVKTSTQDVYKISVATGQQTRLTYFGNVSSLGLGTMATSTPDVALASGVPQVGLADPMEEGLRYFYLDVPSGATNLSFDTSGGTGDVDLFVGYGSKPTLSSYDCGSASGTNIESCSFPAPQSGRWWVALYAYAPYSGVSLVGTYSATVSCSLTLLSPNGGETWYRGSTYPVTWASAGAGCGSSVRLELWKGSLYQANITSSVSRSVGTYSWAISSGLAAAADYSVRVVDTANSSYSDASNGSFAIAGAASGCVPGSTTLCIDDTPGDRRFKIEVAWQTSQGGGQAGTANAIPTTSLGIARGGLFWFFGADNPEMLVKVLNGCSINGNFWVFSSAGTNVGITTTVTDTMTGAGKTYTSPDLTAAEPIQDTSAFPCTGARVAADGEGDEEASAAEAERGDEPDGAQPVPGGEGTNTALSVAACSPDATTLCIDDAAGDKRFRVRLNWSTAQGSGQAGAARPISTAPLGVSRGGLFWFFGADNPEVLVKVLNGCSVNNYYWVFTSAGTNVGMTTTFTDTTTGLTKTYSNPDLTAARPVQDVTAFPCSGGAPQELTLYLPGNVPLTMVRIPAGTFLMGAPANDLWADDNWEKPQHQVTLTKDYYVGKYEVTQAQWNALGGRLPPQDVCRLTVIGGSYPIGCMDPWLIEEWLGSLNAHLVATGQASTAPLRLPTEAEWERAARGGTSTRFFFGDAEGCDPNSCTPCPAVDPYMWWCGNWTGHPETVGSKAANQFGLFDVHGNAEEFVADGSSTYGPQPQTDPYSPPIGTGQYSHLIRGWGGTYRNLQHCTATFRWYNYNPTPDYGLRLARYAQ